VSNYKIMIYSRNRSTLEEIGSYLDTSQYIVQTALSVAEARSLLESEFLHSVIVGEENRSEIMCEIIEMTTCLPWQPACIVYLTHASSETVIDALNAGCSYFIHRHSQLGNLNSILADIANKKHRFSGLHGDYDNREIIHTTITLATEMYSNGSLSRRQREILYHLLMGKTNAEISAQLDISEKTVKNHLWKVYKKFHIENRTQLFHKLLTSSLSYFNTQWVTESGAQHILGSRSP
jgi:DNA-binding NarL/FixJ family response regulator